jgi:hypothetical protein
VRLAVFVRNERDILLLCSAFHRAWLILLAGQKVTTQNIEEMPSLLLGAILGAYPPAELTEKSLADAGLARLAEFQELEDEEEPVALPN